MSDVDRQRAQDLMGAANLDALVVMQPEAFRYVVGAPPGVATMWGRAGAAIAVLPADGTRRIAAIVSDHAAAAIRGSHPEVDVRSHRIWIDQVDLSGVRDTAGLNAAYRRSDERYADARPETFDRAQAYALLGDVLREQGLQGGRIGLDLEFIPAADHEALRKSLPDMHWTDGSLVLRRLRAVKTRAEIERLRQAAAAAEAGLIAMAHEIRPGVALPVLSAAWQAGARSHAAEAGFALSGHWDFISVGADLADPHAIVEAGALIKADVGTLVGGYSSDGARTFCYGQPSRLAQDIFQALSTAFSHGLEQIRPGNRFSAVHAAMQASMRRDGFDHYSRGHFGHSLGGGMGIEEWPFFSAGSDEIIEPGMVVALEAPFYGQGLGAMMIEDQFLVTSQGAQPMTTLSRALLDVSRAERLDDPA